MNRRPLIAAGMLLGVGLGGFGDGIALHQLLQIHSMLSAIVPPNMLMGWGLFNIVEGIIDHHILGVHHVVERLGLSVCDYVFLGSGALLIAIGRSFIRLGRSDDRRVAVPVGESPATVAATPRLTRRMRAR